MVELEEFAKMLYKHKNSLHTEAAWDEIKGLFRKDAGKAKRKIPEPEPEPEVEEPVAEEKPSW